MTQRSKLSAARLVYTMRSMYTSMTGCCWMGQYRSEYEAFLNDGGEGAQSGCVDPDYMHFAFLRKRLHRREPIDDAAGYLLKHVYRSVEAPPGDCILQRIIDDIGESFDKNDNQTRRCPLIMNTSQIRHT